jgi:hypothetical protein
MERFIRRENIKRFRKLLLEAKDEAERRLIQKLLTEEEQKEPPESSSPTPRAPYWEDWACAVPRLEKRKKSNIRFFRFLYFSVSSSIASTQQKLFTICK